jgi:Xaa-Pro dipeptidase
VGRDAQGGMVVEPSPSSSFVVPLGQLFDAHAAVIDRAGFGDTRMNACGYSLGATFAPNWMDWAAGSMLYHGNPTEVAPGMVLFIHIILFDSDQGLAMTTGQTVVVTPEGCRPVTHAPLDLMAH